MDGGGDNQQSITQDRANLLRMRILGDQLLGQEHIEAMQLITSIAQETIAHARNLLRLHSELQAQQAALLHQAPILHEHLDTSNRDSQYNLLREQTERMAQQVAIIGWSSVAVQPQLDPSNEDYAFNLIREHEALLEDQVALMERAALSLRVPAALTDEDSGFESGSEGD